MTETHKQHDLKPAQVRYIKLGAGNAWADEAIANGTLLFGDRDLAFEAASEGNWDEVRTHWQKKGANAGTVTASTRELREFCELGQDCLWITFHKGRLWWAFAKPGVFRPDGDDLQIGFARKVVNGWSSANIHGAPLYEADLSTSLTKTRAYRRTVCSVPAEAYLLRRINGVVDPSIADLENIEAQLADIVSRLITELNDTDFEILISLIAERLGWVRRSALGGPQADIDFAADIPALGVRGYFQVKSAANKAVFDQFLKTIPDPGPTRRAIFACHTYSGVSPAGEGIELWDGPTIAGKTVALGLSGWVKEHIG